MESAGERDEASFGQDLDQLLSAVFSCIAFATAYDERWYGTIGSAVPWRVSVETVERTRMYDQDGHVGATQRCILGLLVADWPFGRAANDRAHVAW